MKRRQFVRLSSLAAGGLATSRLAQANFYIAKKPEVIILGAGFAGLAAAYYLHQKGLKVTVLEARNRIGGRVFSYTADPQENLVIELGAEWVGASHERLIEMCEEFGLPLDNNQFDSRLVYQGKFYDKDQWDYSEPWKAKWDMLMKGYSKLTLAEKKRIDQYDWWRYLVNNGCSGRDLDLRELLDSTDFGESIRHVSALAALAEYAESSPKNEMDFKIRGGNIQFANAIRDRIGADKILLQHKVTEIEQLGKVKVTCSNGKVFTADKLICTAPTFAVKNINWKPALPLEMRRAMNELQYARINKHPVLFTERFWQDEAFDMVTDLPAHYFYHATKNQISKKGILISYTIGDKAAIVGSNKNNDAWNKQMVLDGLRPGYGDVEHLVEKQWNYYWGEDEYSHGAYAFYGIGQWYTVMPILKKPFQHTYFAGEHLAEWQGFMEGAINTGEEAAERIARG